MRFKAYFDCNLLGITISTIILVVCMLLSYGDLQQEMPGKCNQRPNLYFYQASDKIYKIITTYIESSKQRVLISTPNPSASIIEKYFINSLKIAKNNNAKISLLIGKDEKTETLLKNNGITNYTITDSIYTSFVVADSQSFYLNSLLSESDSQQCCFSFFDCETVSDDLSNFFNFQWRKKHNITYSVAPISSHAKTSAINPLIIGNDPNETLYFLVNSNFEGPPLSISIYNYIQKIFQLNVELNISIFSDTIPQPSVSDFSLFTALSRTLITQNFGSPVYINFLVPTKMNATNQKWLRAFNAFSHSTIRLYDSNLAGTNFMIIGKRIIFFSHTLNDQIFANYAGLHLCINSDIIANEISTFYNKIWSNSTELQKPHTPNQQNHL